VIVFVRGVLRIWRLPCAWVPGPARVPERWPLPPVPSHAAVAGRPAAMLWGWRDYEISDAGGARAIESEPRMRISR
jgi:hypothetical protein